jgi:hypothetical protein
LIEVKTTGLGKYSPFIVTANEVRCSEARPGEFQLYRVFNFGPGARLYMLPGAVTGSCHLDATQYRAFVQSTPAVAAVSGVSLPIEQSNERFGVAERVMDGMMVVLRSAETLPRLSATEISDQPCGRFGP